MKFRIKPSIAAMLTIALAFLLTFNSCKKNDNKKCCEGYTGKMTNPMADSLVNRCHFLSEDSIELWVKRYQSYKDQLSRKNDYNTQDGNNKDSMNAQTGKPNAEMDAVAARFLTRGSVSFNSCIIKKILCDKESIGLRVLYGIGGDNRIHIILVGIKPDYSNLYVYAEDDCCTKSMTKALGAGLTAINDTRGGAEYGQMP